MAYSEGNVDKKVGKYVVSSARLSNAAWCLLVDIGVDICPQMVAIRC
jgi:hypothetical protein